MKVNNGNQEKIKVMALGNSKVGKSCFILRFTENRFEKVYTQTTGIDSQTKLITIKEKQYILFFYDTLGQERYKSIPLNIIKDADGILLMYDITDQESFDSIPNWIKNIKEHKGSNFPLILLGNKIDLESDRKISKEQGEKLAQENGLEFFEITNKDGTNVQEAGLAIANKILEKKQKEKLESQNTNTFDLRSKKGNKKKDDSKRCC